MGTDVTSGKNCWDDVEVEVVLVGPSSTPVGHVRISNVRDLAIMTSYLCFRTYICMRERTG